MSEVKSYHIFSFPFKWELKCNEDALFSEKIDLTKIEVEKDSMWKRISTPEKDLRLERELYNEKNFFYRFVHTAMYDNGNADDMVRHFERKECIEGLNTSYRIGHKTSGTVYELRLKSVSLNMFGTGVGVLSFYLENNHYPDFGDVLRINQFGRRIYPPFIHTSLGIEETKIFELADFIEITGMASQGCFREDFSSFGHNTHEKIACFIPALLDDFLKLFDKGKMQPVIDDRMFVSCWYGNNQLADEIRYNRNFSSKSEKWYSYLFIDSSVWATCRNTEMRAAILAEQTNQRWQQEGTLYGISRYSLVSLTDESEFAEKKLQCDIRTMYYRLAELSLVQRASLLNFSAEVTRISELNQGRPEALSESVSDLYKEYIRFVNKVYFREVTAQEQGIELYDKLQQSMRIPDHVKDLDEEIGELHNYVSLKEEKLQSRKLNSLTILAALFAIPAFVTGFFGMNIFSQPEFGYRKAYLLITILITAVSTWLAWKIFTGGRSNNKKTNEKRLTYIVLLILMLSVLIVTPFIYKVICQSLEWY